MYTKIKTDRAHKPEILFVKSSAVYFGKNKKNEDSAIEPDPTQLDKW